MLTEQEWIQVDLLGTAGFTRDVRGGADLASLDALATQIGFELPEDYRRLLLQMDGFEGFVGSVEEGSYLQLYACAETMNCQNYGAESEPNLYIFGSNGGDAAYCLDVQTWEWLELPYLDFGEVGERRLERRFGSLTSMMSTLRVP